MLRQKLYYALEAKPQSGRAGWLNRLLLLLIFIDVVVMACLTLPQLDQLHYRLLYGIDAAILTIFGLEYLARLWVAVEDREQRYAHPIWGRVRYALSPLALLDALVFLPVLLGLSGGLDLAFLRLGRLLLLVKVLRYSPALNMLGIVIYKERRSLYAVMLIMMVLLMIASSIIWLFEREAQPDQFASIPAAMWWGIVTLTTIGYGDVVPITPMGKIFAGFVAMLGLATFSLPAAIMAAGFAREIRQSDFMITFSMLARVPLLASLDAARLAEIAQLLQPRLVPLNYHIARRGEPADAMYFITEGDVAVELPGGGEITLTTGDFFGEISLLERAARRSATITARTECRLLALAADDFHSLMDGWPDLRDRLASIARERQQKSSDPAPAALVDNPPYD